MFVVWVFVAVNEDIASSVSAQDQFEVLIFIYCIIVNWNWLLGHFLGTITYVTILCACIYSYNLLNVVPVSYHPVFVNAVWWCLSPFIICSFLGALWTRFWHCWS